jgi:hypothetical protein
MRKKAPKVEYSEHWVCATCETNGTGRLESESRSRQELIEHLAGTHSILPPQRATRNMVMHLDEARVYYTTYEWLFQASAPLQPPVKVFQYQSGPRR